MYVSVFYIYFFFHPLRNIFQIEGNYWVQNAGFWCELVLGLVVMVVVVVRGPLMWFPYVSIFIYVGLRHISYSWLFKCGFLIGWACSVFIFHFFFFVLFLVLGLFLMCTGADLCVVVVFGVCFADTDVHSHASQTVTNTLHYMLTYYFLCTKPGRLRSEYPSGSKRTAVSLNWCLIGGVG